MKGNRKSMKLQTIAILTLGFNILTGCAPQEPSDASPRPIVVLQLPDTVTEERFWLGVINRQFYWTYSGGEKEMKILNHLQSSVDLSRGGRLSFVGLSANGTILVHGETEVPAWKGRAGEQVVVIFVQRGFLN